MVIRVLAQQTRKSKRRSNKNIHFVISVFESIPRSATQFFQSVLHLQKTAKRAFPRVCGLRAPNPHKGYHRRYCSYVGFIEKSIFQSICAKRISEETRTFYSENILNCALSWIRKRSQRVQWTNVHKLISFPVANKFSDEINLWCCCCFCLLFLWVCFFPKWWYILHNF